MTYEGAFVAPFQGAQPIPSADWVQISEPGTFADKPRWSPSGELLYHTSDRDGFVCIYARRLDPETKQPRGELIEIYHSHDARLSIANVGLPSLEIDVARDKIVFGMAELTGNIWMMDGGTAGLDERHSRCREGLPVVTILRIAFPRKQVVYVGRSPDGERSIQVSTGGGGAPRWKTEGGYLFYVAIHVAPNRDEYRSLRGQSLDLDAGSHRTRACIDVIDA